MSRSRGVTLPKRCKTCGKRLERREYPSGPERLSLFEMRDYCGRECRNGRSVFASIGVDPKHRLARRVLAFIQGTTGWGATCDDVERELGLRHQTASARCRELELAGRIVKTQEKRPTSSGRRARVYKTKEHAYKN